MNCLFFIQLDMKCGGDVKRTGYCLIGGTGRCGTTILKTVFSRHPDVADIPEWRFSTDPDGLIDFYSGLLASWSPFLFDKKLKRLESTLMDLGGGNVLQTLYRLAMNRLGIQKLFPVNLIPRYSDIHIRKVCPEYKTMVRTLIDELTMFRYKGHWTGNNLFEKRSIAYSGLQPAELLAEILGRFFRNVIKRTLESQGKSVYLEDNTWNILHFKSLLDLIPEAKLVHIYRDPRDVVCSFIKQTWMPSDLDQSSKIYMDLMDSWWAVRDRIPVGSFLEISLEGLVSEPEKTIREVAQFWDMRWHESLLGTPLNRSHSGRWKKELSKEEQNYLDKRLSRYIQKLNYK